MVRATSKKLFNSQYRIEVAELVGAMPDRFTTLDLADALGRAGSALPWSCVVKELAVLESVGLVTRAPGRTVEGRIPYALGPGYAAFLSFIRELTPAAIAPLATVQESNITPIRRS
jgi:hypothetical protein